MSPQIKDHAIEILKENYLCDHCLGRQFASLLTGYSNDERGKIIRYFLAFLIDSEENIKVNESNFYNIKFRNIKFSGKKPGKCYLCNDIFKKIKIKANEIIKKISNYEYNTFLIGSNPPNQIMKKESEFWEKYGIEWSESINTEINREIGKEIEKLTGKKLDRKLPDITILYDFNKSKISFQIRSIFIYGEYQKFSRKIPQTKWKTRIYKMSVQSFIEKPLLKQTLGEKTSFHGVGREDVDVRCFAWRPFIIEILNPKKRELDIKKAQNEINKSKYIKVKNLRITDKNEVKFLKSIKPDKTYRVIVTFEKPINNIKKLDSLKNVIINQQTPIRVLQRRSDRLRKRMIKDIKYRILSKKKLEIIIRAQSGLYIKELIHGDNGRTTPNVADILNNKVKNIELDVIKIHKKG